MIKHYAENSLYISMAQYLDELLIGKMSAMDMVDKAVSFQVKGVELRREPWLEYRRQLKTLRSYAEEKNIKIVFATNSALFSKTQEDEKLLLDDIDAAAILGSTLLRVFMGKAPTEDDITAWEKSKNTVRYAQSIGVKIALENGGGASPTKLSCIRYVLDRIQSPALGTNLDIGNYFVGNQDIAEAVETLGDRIICTHIKDVDKEGNSTFLGGGCMALEGVFNALTKLPCDLPNVFEFDGNGEADMRISESIDYIFSKGRGNYGNEG